MTLIVVFDFFCQTFHSHLEGAVPGHWSLAYYVVYIQQNCTASVIFYFGCPRQTHWTSSSTGPLWPRMLRHWQRFHLSFQIKYLLQLDSICHLRVSILKTAPDTGRHRLDIRPHCAIGLVAKTNRWKQSEELNPWLKVKSCCVWDSDVLRAGPTFQSCEVRDVVSQEEIVGPL